MRRTLILCAGALLIAAPASNNDGKRAKVSRAHKPKTQADRGKSKARPDHD
jgi:hypothetical protein